MNKLFTKIAALSVGLAMAIGVGVAVGGRSVKVAKAADAAFMTFDFEDSSAHRTSGSNTYSSTPNVYVENGSNISLTYADSVTTGTPLSGSANVLGRVAKKTTNSPEILVGPMNLSTYAISGFSYKIKGVGAMSVATTYSTDGSTWNSALATYNCPTSSTTKTSDTLSIDNPASLYFKLVVTVASSTDSNRDFQFDDLAIIGHSTSSSKLESISCPNQEIGVTESVDLSSQITFTPADAQNKNVSYSIKSGSDEIDLSDGVVTGKKGGTAVVTITPEDTSGGASAIDVTITVNSIPAPSITVGEQYAIYAIDSTNDKKAELTGVASNLGTVSYFTGEIPSCAKVFDTEEGYFENTVAFKLGDYYLSLNSAGNNLHTLSEVTAASSWIVAYDSGNDVTTMTNASLRNRSLKFNYNNNNARFACYTSGQVDIQFYHYEEKPLQNFTIESEASVYRTGTHQIEVTYDPADAADKSLTWTSADENIATVNQNGVVTGVAVGETIITASKTIQGVLVERTCAVTVLNNVSAHRGTEADPFNIADAVEVAKGIFTEDPDGTAIDLTNEYYVAGLLTASVTRTTTKVTVWLGDNESQVSAATGAFEIYQCNKIYGQAIGTYYTDYTNDTVVADFTIGAHILVKSTLTVYNGTSETTNGASDIIYSDYIEARKFAEGFNAAFEDEEVCDADGKSDVSVLASVWSNQANLFDALDSNAQGILTDANADTKASATTIQKCAAKYDYIGGKYQTQLGAEYDFMSRNPSPVGNAYRGLSVSMEDNNMTIIIVVIAATSAIALSVLLLLKKRKQK